MVWQADGKRPAYSKYTVSIELLWGSSSTLEEALQLSSSSMKAAQRQETKLCQSAQQTVAVRCLSTMSNKFHIQSTKEALHAHIEQLSRQSSELKQTTLTADE